MLYYGRGLPQLTWLNNYQVMGKRLAQPLAENPDLMHDPKISVAVLIEGMEFGIFTGKRLDAFINNTGTNYGGARQVVNGMDKFAVIASYATDFEAAMRLPGAIGHQGGRPGYSYGQACCSGCAQGGRDRPVDQLV